MTDKNEINLSLGAQNTTELFVDNEKIIGNKALQEALRTNKCVMSFGKDGDNIRHLPLPLTSLGMVV